MAPVLTAPFCAPTTSGLHPGPHPRQTGTNEGCGVILQHIPLGFLGFSISWIDAAVVNLPFTRSFHKPLPVVCGSDDRLQEEAGSVRRVGRDLAPPSMVVFWVLG